jgi:hypothetical protein
VTCQTWAAADRITLRTDPQRQPKEVRDLEKQHRAQLLGLGAIALEMHQKDEIEAELPMDLGDQVAETEEELRLLRRQTGPEAG